MANRRFIDFPIASTVGDSDIILIWQSGVNKQTTKATFLSGLPENLDELNDVAISGLTNGQILRYDSVTGKWVNTDQGNLDLNDLNDVSIVSPSNGQVLVYNSSTSKWENSSGGFVPYVGAVTTVDLGAQGLRAGYVRFDTSVASVPDEQGLMYWDASRSTAALIMNGTLQHIGQDSFFYVKNSSGSTIHKGTCVRFAGTDGASGHLLIVPFLANGSVPSTYFMGVTSEEIANGSFGQVMHFGELTGINTSGFTAGALLYASTTVAGAFQTTAPVAPNNIVLVAAAVNSKNNGAIIVRPQIGSNINNDEGVKITSPTTGDLLQLQAGGLWENKTKAQILGGTSSQFVKGDSSLDSTSYQPLLTNPVTGTGTTNYLPKFTGTSSIGNSIVQDAGIRVDIGGDIRLTPSSAVNIQAYTGSVYTNLFYNAASHNWQTSGGATKMFLNSNDNLLIGTTTDGGQRLQVTGTVALRASASGSSATQIPIFNADPSGTTRELVTRTPAQLLSDIGGQAALTNPVTGTGTTNYLPKFTGSTTIGNSQIFDNGTNVGIGTASPSTQLQVVGSSFSIIRISGASDNVVGVDFGTVASPDIARIRYSNSTNSFTIRANGSDYLFLNSSGNLGLGVTPSAWTAGGRNIEVGSAGNIIQAQLGQIAVIQNATFNAGWKYSNNGFASFNLQTSGQHQWFTAPSGTAGNAISFTQAMTLTSGGNLLVGTTSDNGARLQVSGTATFSSSVTAGDLISTSYGTARIQITSTTNNTNAGLRFTAKDSGGTSKNSGLYYVAGTNTSNTFLSLSADDNNYQFNVLSSGNVGIGITNPIYKFEISDGTRTGVFNPNSVLDGFFIGTYQSKPLILGTADTDRMRITSGGNVLIGTTTDNGARLQVSGTSTLTGNVSIGTSSLTRTLNLDSSDIWVSFKRTGNREYLLGGGNTDNFRIQDATAGVDRITLNTIGEFRVHNLGTGTVYSNNGILTNTNPSDFNLKENIVPINYGLGEILQLNPVTFNWKNDTINQGKQYGFIAQEVQNIMPDLVKKGEYLGLDKEAIFTTLVKAIQELKQEIDTLKN